MHSFPFFEALFEASLGKLLSQDTHRLIKVLKLCLFELCIAQTLAWCKWYSICTVPSPAHPLAWCEWYNIYVQYPAQLRPWHGVRDKVYVQPSTDTPYSAIDNGVTEAL